MTSNQIAAKANKIADEKNKRDDATRKSEGLKDRRSKERIAREDRRQSNINSSRQAAASILSGITGAAGRVGGSAISAFGKGNHPEWYTQDQNLAESVANISYEAPLGRAIDTGNLFYGRTGVSGKITIPGIMVLNFIDTLGGDNSLDKITTVANQIYSWVRHANSGSRNYEPSDLIMYLLYMSNVYSYMADLERMLRILGNADSMNWYVSKLVTALGFDYNDALANYPAYKILFNTYANIINSFNVPNIMPLFQRKLYLNSRVFKDTDDDRSQLFVFVRKGYFIWSTSINDATTLQYTEYSIPARTYDSVAADLRKLVDEALAIEDVGLMSGDIRKAYGAEQLYTIHSVSDWTWEGAIYDEGACSQLRSGWVLPSSKADLSDIGFVNSDRPFDIWQLGIYIKQGHYTSSVLTGFNGSPIIPSMTSVYVETTDRPQTVYPVQAKKVGQTAGENLVSTMFMPVIYTSHVSVQSAPVELIHIKSSRSEILSGGRIYYFNPDAPNELRDITFADGQEINPTVINYTFNNSPIFALETYTNRPFVRFHIPEDNTITGPLVIYSTLDWKYTTFISDETLQRMNDAVMISLYGIPNIGKQ